MGRRLNRLTAKAVEQMKRSGYWPDGGGLYLQVSPTRTKSWIFKFAVRGKAREMGLGSLNAFGLAEARERAQAARKLVADGVDPISARRAARAQVALAEAKSITFGKCAERYIAVHREEWKNPKHASQWVNTIKTYCAPFNALPVQAVERDLVLKVLEPIWTTKPETASRLRGRIESILNWATVSGYRAGDNPARWRGHLDQLLPTINNVKHHAALPYKRIAEFMDDLRKQHGTAARALEFTILTAARTGEVIGARPEEFDLKKALWIVPALRMKAGREHRVPLSPRAVAIVVEQLKLGNDFLFPGLKVGKPISSMAMLMMLRRMKREDLTVHGFRSCFRDWASEETNYPREVCELALAHAVGDKVEAAYRRGDLFEKRRLLALDWAKYCARVAKSGKVLPMRKQAAGEARS